MAKFDDKVNGNTVDASEYNNVVRAFKNSIEDSGQTIDASNTQMSLALANYSAVSTYYTDSGAADAYVLNPIGSLKSPDSYYDGMLVRFRAGNANTGASTVNVNSLGVVNIKQKDGTTDIVAGQIPADSDVTLRYDNANSAFLLEGVVSATETQGGIAEIATQSEVTTATDDGTIVTPLKLGLAFTPVFRVYRNGTQAITGGVDTKVLFDTVSFDPLNEYDETTNYRYTPQRAGYYLINSHVRVDQTTDSAINETKIRKNGVDIALSTVSAKNGSVLTLNINNTTIIEMNGTTDYLEVFFFIDNNATIQPGSGNTTFSAHYIGGLNV